jgi:hypothetical protein
MAGLCWIVQLVHYPLLARLAREQPEMLPSIASEHASRTTLIVAPAMLIEAASCVLLIMRAPEQPLATLAGAGLVVVWASTFGVQVPLHGRLQRGGPNVAAVARRLVVSNWIRTLAWTLRGVVALMMMAPASV